MQEPGILGILEYSELFHNGIATQDQKESWHIYKNLGILITLACLKPSTYLEPSQRFKMEFFAKIFKNYNYFSKALHLRSLTEF